MPASHTVQSVAVRPLQKLSAGQAAHWRLVVDVQVLTSYWVELQAAVQGLHTVLAVAVQGVEE